MLNNCLVKDNIVTIAEENILLLESEREIAIRNINRALNFDQWEEFEDELCRINQSIKENMKIIERL